MDVESEEFPEFSEGESGVEKPVACDDSGRAANASTGHPIRRLAVSQIIYPIFRIVTSKLPLVVRTRRAYALLV